MWSFRRIPTESHRTNKSHVYSPFKYEKNKVCLSYNFVKEECSECITLAQEEPDDNAARVLTQFAKASSEKNKNLAL